jgi:hypothetical protein
VTVLVQKLGDDVVDFVFKTFVSIMVRYVRHPEIATFPTQPFLSHPERILLPTGTQIRHLSMWQVQLAPRPRIVCTFDTQTLLYCLFTPYYSGITAVMVEWVPDARHCFVQVALPRRTVCPW